MSINYEWCSNMQRSLHFRSLSISVFLPISFQALCFLSNMTTFTIESLAELVLPIHHCSNDPNDSIVVIDFSIVLFIPKYLRRSELLSETGFF